MVNIQISGQHPMVCSQIWSHTVSICHATYCPESRTLDTGHYEKI